MAKSGQERRKYLRIGAPLRVRAISKDSNVCETQTKDISPLGLRFEVKGCGFDVDDSIEIKIELPKGLSAVHAKAKVAWKRKITTEDASSLDIGCEFTKIEEDNKNTFLKYFCDLLYERGKGDTGKGEE